jgi:hypothetical protein
VQDSVARCVAVILDVDGARNPLCLGSGESGKTTLVKQMKIIYQGGFSPTELAEYRPVVYTNVLDSAQRVIIYMKKIGLEYKECSNRVCSGLMLPLLSYLTALKGSRRDCSRVPA